MNGKDGREKNEGWKVEEKRGRRDEDEEERKGREG